MTKLILVGVALLASLPMTAAARGRVGVFIGPSFGRNYGWYEPYWGMYPYGPYFAAPNAGERVEVQRSR